MNNRAASHHGPSSVGIARHVVPFRWRQKMAASVRRNSFGGVWPRSRTASISGSHTAHSASVKPSVPAFPVMPQTWGQNSRPNRT
jgi:hypothetical protein